ncbi:Aspartate/glutamate/uridylate kinase [Dichotomocladium elegans]|nr:Aspartate/glutamate/uridylate kinase [Dichotomocladium elegans]
MSLVNPTPLLQNPVQRPWVVHKLGGTCVAKYIDSITTQIIPESLRHNRIVVVCSARSNGDKLTGTTSKLIRAMEAACSSEPDDCLLLMNEVLADHLVAVREIIDDCEIRAALEQEIMHDCCGLGPLLKQSAQTLNALSPRLRDTVIGVGEKMACKIVTAALRDRGVDSIFISLEDIIDAMQCSGSGSHVLDQDFYDCLAGHIADKVQSGARHRVPVVTGFFGPVPGSLLTTIGRGYTDLCAALVAVGLGAEKIQIWKEVDGIFTADPRKVNSARLLPVISPEEAAVLTYYGSEVVHPFSIAQVIRKHIPIYIQNVKCPAHPGTLITTTTLPASTTTTTTPPPSPDYAGSEEQVAIIVEGPKAVTIKKNIIALNIRSNRNKISHAFFASIFSILDRHCIVVDLTTTSEVQVSMAVCMDTNGDKCFPQVLEELRTLGRVDISRNMAILTLVGKGVGHMPELAGRLFTTLAMAGINIEMLSQGASEIHVSCVIEAASAIAALNIVHDRILCKKHELSL